MGLPFNRLLPALASLALLQLSACALAGEDAVVIPPPAQDLAEPGGSATAVFAGGCFWGVQGVFQHLRGVRQVLAGYAGGSANTAQYETVSGGDTGHAEAVQITYDPQQVSYGTLLQVFFSVAHDPTQLDRQGPDRGSQYRSAIFAHDDGQKAVAQAYIRQLDAAHVYPKAIATRLEPLAGFYRAEDYHQNYLTNHPGAGYIVVNDLPKVEHLQQLFGERYLKAPVLVP
ncbi:peptide-methionine (S)-S-oxide reductase MsrA [Pseudomonas sp. NPDC007930]|uniref:peptide-methionine (S)-S-oxide reductase MsrA n=1 Tax=Pseudomonas sp. NPDC007930 TaxID=3364417 RepID=UPI0036E9B150